MPGDFALILQGMPMAPSGPVQGQPPHSVNGWNAEFIDALYQKWSANPDSVDPQWKQFFQGFELGLTQPASPGRDGKAAASAAPAASGGGAVAAPREPAPTSPTPTPVGSLPPVANTLQAKVDSLIYHYRDIGHLASDLDPLGTERPFPDTLTLESFDLSDEDLDKTFDPGVLPLDNPAPLKEIIQLLEDTYCRHIGVEYMHIQQRERRRFLQKAMETTRNKPAMPRELRRHLLKQLTEADAFENFLKNRYVGKKRFGLEGGESLIPMVDQIVELGPANGVKEFSLGMAHRGRLNVLVNILNKSYDQLFTEFEEAWVEDFTEGGGDVKYHGGYSSDHTTTSGQPVHLTLASNPSHLEFINSVVLGRTRAKQRLHADASRELVVPILIHGDAAFPGQGIVAECFNMMRLDGYTVGGAIHIVINNQVGFTTNPSDEFSGRYCTDMAKMVDAPIFHVNGDDPEACAWVARMALEYRQAFKNDVVIDMWCYRKHGHNETDEPSFTQPLMYQRIKRQKPVLQKYADRLIAEGEITKGEFEAVAEQINTAMDSAHTRTKEKPVKPKIAPFGHIWHGLNEEYSSTPVDTSTTRDVLGQVAKALGTLPEGFTPHKVVQGLLEYRGNAIAKNEPIDWALGELFAYGTLLLEGHAIRLTGQDVERGTFSHRHCVVNDQKLGDGYCALNHLGGEQAKFCVHNSPLTEAACVGFEYGYSLTDPKMLLVWEAQFGDFANGAQVIIDQFLASAEAKWNRSSGLVLFLPHGYEGQGPEHSSARLERFLQLCADNNMQVVYPTTPAQIFHLLRRQMKRNFRKPLVVMTPKSLLRNKRAVSALDEFTGGRFQRVIDDAFVQDPQKVNRILLCSGKVYYDLVQRREDAGRDDVAIIRLEQLYPFAESKLGKILERYRRNVEIAWVQEEPRNMGAWWHVRANLEEKLNLVVPYIGRDDSPTPACGSEKMHKQQQAKILAAAIPAGASTAPAKQTVVATG
jgi:2-oxoglutarate dehydrogenase E1 component